MVVFLREIMAELRPKDEEEFANGKGEWSRGEEVSGTVISRERIMFPHKS